MHACSSFSVMSDSCKPIDCCPPGSSVHGISQARILEWVAISSFKRSSWPRYWTHISYVSCTSNWVLYQWATWEASISKHIFPNYRKPKIKKKIILKESRSLAEWWRGETPYLERNKSKNYLWASLQELCQEEQRGVKYLECWGKSPTIHDTKFIGEKEIN